MESTMQIFYDNKKYNDFNCSIAQIADDFYEAYLRCRQGVTIQGDNRNYCTHVVNVPAIVNGSFAIELYLKSMIKIKKSKMTKTHSIKKLFDMLEKDAKKSVVDKITKGKNLDFTFQESIAALDDAFSFWRYIHEKDNFGHGFAKTMTILPIFVDAIREEAKKIL